MYVGTSVRSPRGTVEVSVVMDGSPQPLYRRPNDSKLFVVGVPGQAYELQVMNLGHERAEVILAIDGRNTLKDEPGDAQRNQGLVFASYYRGNLTGWRLNDRETREFVFGHPARSIAAQATGSTSNVGVIGFAVYTERRPLESYTPTLIPKGVTRGVVRGGSASEQVMMGGSLGTGMGELRHDPVGTTQFTRSSDRPDILVIGYDLHEVLEAQGILGPAEPNPFPGAGTGYEKYAAQ